MSALEEPAAGVAMLALAVLAADVSMLALAVLAAEVSMGSALKVPGETVPRGGSEASTADVDAGSDGGADDGKGYDGYARILLTRRQRRRERQGRKSSSWWYLYFYLFFSIEHF